MNPPETCCSVWFVLTDPQREDLVRTLYLIAALSTLAAPAVAQSLAIQGKTGYMGEYELRGSVSEHIANGKQEFSGPLIITHVGLCTHDGPKETISQISFRRIGSSRITATLLFEGSECSYQGFLSEAYHGFMDCADNTSLPLRLWTK
jgi:hypothetical protein